jgi:hypothetical protein
MGGGNPLNPFGGGKSPSYSAPAIDNSAQIKAAEEAARAEEKKRQAEAAEAERKRHIAASGRQSTILAGENTPKTLLGG